MAEQPTGHESARDDQDAFDLSEEEFADVLASAGEGSDEDDTQEAAPEPSDTAGGNTEEPEPPAEPSAEGFELVDAPEEPPETPTEPTEGADGKLRIVHNGKEIDLTEDRVRELAQKGYDYDYKIGKHQRLAKLADTDPRIAMMIDDLVMGRIEYDPREGLKPAGEAPAEEDIKSELKPIEEYEDPNDWLIENAETILKKKSLTPEEKDDGLTPEQRILQDRDAMAELMIKRSSVDVFEKVAPGFTKALGELPHNQMVEVTSSLDAILKFYDHLAAQVSGPPKAPPPPRKTKPPQFTVATRSAPPAVGAQANESVWSMSKKDFEAKLSQAKGY